MKKLLILLITAFVNINTFSQDIIILKNGDEIKSKVLEISSDQIKYKKWGNIDGPTYSSLKTEVFMIKYQNGEKDVFKTQESVNTTIVPMTNEDAKKNEALKKLEGYVNNKLTNSFIKAGGLRKKNGTMNNVFGQMIYTIECDVDIRFIKDGWKTKEGLEGYWSNFKIYGSEPDLSGLYYYKSILFPRGTFLTLGCVAKLKSTDNGFEVYEFYVNSFTDHGIQSIPNNGNIGIEKTAETEPKQTTPILQSYVGDLKDGRKEGKGKQIFEDGSIYEGEWKNDKMDGSGSMVYANGAIYGGAWVDNKYEGIGTLYDENKNLYVGSFKNGLKEGIGKMTYALESFLGYEYVTIFEGTFKENKEYNGVLSAYYGGDVRKKELIITDGVWGKWKKN